MENKKGSFVTVSESMVWCCSGKNEVLDVCWKLKKEQLVNPEIKSLIAYRGCHPTTTVP